MYSLIVGEEPSGSDLEDFPMLSSRYLEYTSGVLKPQFTSLSVEARATLMSWPCLCMAEGTGDGQAVIGQITAIDADVVPMKVTVRILHTDPAINNDVIWRLREELDIQDFEFHRYHWALKERDLLGPVANAGIGLIAEEVARFSRLPLPAPPRSELLSAKQVIGHWNHTEITDLLLEAGIDDLKTTDGVSRRDRANEILTYAFGHPSAKTAEGSLLSAFLVRKAGPPQSEAQAQGAASRPDVAPPPAVPPEESRASNRVFVVHGSNAIIRDRVVQFLGNHGLEGIVLNQMPNMGDHLLTKFFREAALTTFAVVLLTDDDIGNKVDEPPRPRARRNVILELGYFLSRLGQSRICALKTPGLETPSDFDGIVYIAMDDTGAWEAELLRELIAAELPVRRP